MKPVSRKRMVLVLILIGLLCVACVVSANASRTDKDGADKQRKEGKEQPPASQQKYEEIIQRLDEMQQQVSWLSRTSPPVGVVMAFAGEWPPKKGEGGKWTEEELGWMLCDGRKLDGTTYAELRAALGKDALPDYRGYFLRGVDVSINGKPSGRDPDGIRPLNREQGYATALPKQRRFIADDNDDSNHSHVLGLETTATRTINPNEASNTCAVLDPKDRRISDRSTPSGGKHKHSISGGDPETRPVNVAVYWIIKFK